MFDFIAKIVELVIQGTDQYSEKKEQKRKREFGVALMTCYFHILEVIKTGRTLLDALEEFDTWYKDNYKQGMTERAGNVMVWRVDYLASLAETQGRNLSHLDMSLGVLRRELLFFAPETAEQLTYIQGRKRRNIHMLAQSLLHANIPTHLNWERPSFDLGGRGVLLRVRRIPIEKTDPDDLYDQLHEYLENDHPSERLDALVVHAEELRKLLLEHFSLADVLWGIDKGRPKASEQGHIEEVDIEQ
jgi:hypothetical protein